MRVSVIGLYHPDSFSHNISFTLERMGHQVQFIDHMQAFNLNRLPRRFRKVTFLLEMQSSFQAKRDKFIINRVKEHTPDLVINTFPNIHPDSVDTLRESLGKDCRIVFMYPDANANLGRDYPLASDYDALFFKDPFAVEIFRTRLNINARYLPQSCNPVWHRSVELTQEDIKKYGCDLTTAGNIYYFRSRTLEIFVDYDLKIWGNNWPRWLHSPLRSKFPGVYVSEMEKAKAFLAAKIVINTLSHKEIEGINLRTFEAAGCGAFQIADWRPDMDRLFKPDEEIVTYRSRDELKEKVDYYLAQPEKRKKIAQAGQRRAHQDHTYERRMQELLRVVETL